MTRKSREFESHPLRHIWRSTQVGRRGAPAKGIGRESGARVRIPPSPPKPQVLKPEVFSYTNIKVKV